MTYSTYRLEGNIKFHRLGERMLDKTVGHTCNANLPSWRKAFLGLLLR